MRLALITQDFPPKIGGIQTYALELGKRFYEETDFFCVIAPEVDNAAATDTDFPFTVHRISSTEPLLGWAALPWLPPFIRKHKIDTVFHAQWNTLPVSVWMKKQGLIKRIFVAAHGREFLFNPLGNGLLSQYLYHKYRQKLLTHVDGVFPVSHFTASLLEQDGIAPDKIQVVSNGTDPSTFYPKKNTHLKKKLGLSANKVLLTVTRLVSRKGIDTVLRAMPKVLHAFPEAYYVIGGEGEDLHKLQSLSRQLKIEDKVMFIGRIPNAELTDYYSMADVFVMPSKSEYPDVEGFGLVFLEANACETPVIGSKSGGIPDAISPGKTGLLVEEQDPDALAQSIIRLFEDPEWADNLGKNGRERILHEMNWDNATAEILRMMKKKY